jgi:hypothetical protein
MDIQLNEKGYMIIKGLFEKEELLGARSTIQKFVKENKTLRNSDGITIPDFIKKEALREIEIHDWRKKIEGILQEKVFGDRNFRFCSHNDIGVNRIVGWHKDKLNGEYAKYETIPIWSTTEKGEKHEIYKVLIYLQDQEELCVVPESHRNPHIDVKGVVQVKTELGDIIIFDQRISHRGAEKHMNQDRILVSYGYGRNNPFTDNFERGTIERQNKQVNSVV